MLAIAPELFPHIAGSTDSEVMFFLALTFGLQDDPIRGVERVIRFIEDVARAHNVADPLQMTLAIMGGRSLYAFRYASAGRAYTLFHNASIATLRRQFPAVSAFTDDARAVVSEPLGPPESGRKGSRFRKRAPSLLPAATWKSCRSVRAPRPDSPRLQLHEIQPNE